ncbi:MAG TPA: hypothetical protein VFR94_06155 [Nitrososphaeraceae archaeon]|nr:hypothetical protein [Nitrososphaeraceae archaeon]
MNNSQSQRLNSKFQRILDEIWAFHRNVKIWVGRPCTEEALETG